MGSIIEKVHIIRNQFRRGYMHTGSTAINRCLRKAGMGLENVGVLINAGVYADNFLQEPAFAAMLQGKAQKRVHGKPENMFSFDLQEGGGGMVMAFRILNGFLNSGKIENGLVVAGDAANYSELAGAVLLTKGKPGVGFEQFSQDIYPEYSADYNSYTKYLDGRLESIINQSDEYLDHCTTCMNKSIAGFLEKEHLGMEEIHLIISSQSPRGVARRLHELYPGDKVSGIDDGPEVYSAGLVYSLDLAMHNQRFSHAKRILFVSVGAGITVSLALYRNKT